MPLLSSVSFHDVLKDLAAAGRSPCDGVRSRSDGLKDCLVGGTLVAIIGTQNCSRFSYKLRSLGGSGLSHLRARLKHLRYVLFSEATVTTIGISRSSLKLLYGAVGGGGVDYNADSSLELSVKSQVKNSDSLGETSAYTHKYGHIGGHDNRLSDDRLRSKRIGNTASIAGF